MARRSFTNTEVHRMIERVIVWSARNPFLIGLATIALIIGGIIAVLRTPLDALPDLSDVQVIVYTEYPGQAPQVVEDQVTYPLTTAMLSVPKSSVVRGFSFFGVSFVYVIFEDGTDIYWARSRVLEYLNAASERLPRGVTPQLGPDATGVGWVYQYALTSKQHTLAELRSLQDWFVRYQLTGVEGVSEIASIGGFVQQYQVIVDPARLRAYGISLMRIGEVIRASNRDVGGRVVEMAETEYMVRGRGYLRSGDDIGDLVLRADRGTPVRIRDVARVELGPDERRGVAELNGEGEVVSGIVVARFGANALQVIENVKRQDRGDPSGLAARRRDPHRVRPLRSDQSRDQHAGKTLALESLIVALVCALFLLHARSALVVIVVLPLGVLFSFVCMRALGINSNIMSLGGIAIAIGAMIDAGIVMVENAHKHLERRTDKADDGVRIAAIMAACREVGPALFFSLLIVTVSFLPVFSLEAQEGRLFAPLAYTKTFAMAGGALLSVTLLPMLMVYLVRGKILPENRNPLNRVMIASTGRSSAACCICAG
jgi:copper/silver efflux system protein